MSIGSKLYFVAPAVEKPNLPQDVSFAARSESPAFQGLQLDEGTMKWILKSSIKAWTATYAPSSVLKSQNAPMMSLSLESSAQGEPGVPLPYWMKYWGMGFRKYSASKNLPEYTAASWKPKRMFPTLKPYVFRFAPRSGYPFSQAGASAATPSGSSVPAGSGASEFLLSSIHLLS